VSGLVLAGATLVLGACAAGAETLVCPPETKVTLSSTTEGKQTWWACRDDAGRLEGPSRMTYGDGRPRSVGAYRADEMDGRWTYFDRAGHVEAEGVWVGGKREGRWLWTDGNGSRVEEYRAGKQEGHFVRRLIDGTLAEEGDYVAGEKVGHWRTWNPKGQVEVDEELVAGEQRVVRRTYHENGALASETEYVAGTPAGHAVTFHYNGAKESEGDYADGRASGHWVYWSADGRVTAEGKMLDGKRHGVWKIANRTAYFENGREGAVRACPPGTQARFDCIADCCERTGRWCERPDGVRVGPMDVWDISGARLPSISPK
jgi:antitoxin component YwqK of YwqJK toxin-antitoxin module